MNKRGKLNKIKILGAVCLSFIIIGVCVGYNSSKETSFFSEIKDKNLLAADIVSPQTWGGCKWKIESTGKLFIYASTAANGFEAGEMGNLSNISSAPWYNYRDKIKTVQVGQSGKPVIVKTGNKIGGMFTGCTNLTTINFVNFNTTNATNMQYLFNNCSSLTKINGFETINATNATSMHRMFYNCSSLRSLTIGSGFNSAKVETMSAMFHGCTSLTTINGFENIKTSKVTDMNHMFSNCDSIESLPFGNNFNTANVTNMSYMFSECAKPRVLDVSKFNTKKVTNAEKMFYNGRFEVIDISGTNFTSRSMTNMTGMFPGTPLKELRIGKFDFKMGDLSIQPY